MRAIDPERNTVMLGTALDMEDMGCIVEDINWISVPEPQETLDAKVRIRYRSKDVPARIEPLGPGRCHVLFAEKVKAVTPGQSAVFYDGDKVLGGGIIVLHGKEKE